MLVIVSAVGVMPDTAVDDVITIVTWIVAGLASEPVASTGAESEVVLFAGAAPGTHVRAPPVVMLSSTGALVVHVPAAAL